MINIKQNSEHCSLFLYVRTACFLLLALVLMSIAGCTPPIEPIVLSGPTMGTQYRVTVVPSRDQSHQQERLSEAITNAMSVVNQSMSTYIPDSELSLFNKMPSGSSIEMSSELQAVMKEALRISEFSSGAFDATIGQAIRLWGFSEDGRINERPTKMQLELVKASVGYHRLSLEGQTLTKMADNLEVNLSAIAKGYAVDLVAEAIESLGYKNYLVNIGGELRAAGKNAEHKPWRVGVEKPHILGGIEQVVKLVDAAIATSGDYRNFLVIDGQRFSHTIDSTTLTPVLHKLASVSVLSDKAITADGLATALLAMGEQKGIEFAKKNSIAAYFIIRQEHEAGYKIVITDGFKANLLE